MSKKPIFVFESEALNLEDVYLLPEEEKNKVIKQLFEIAGQLDEKVSFLEDVIDMAGLDINIVNNAFEAKQKALEQYSDDLNSSNEEVKEHALKMISDITIEALKPILDDKRFKKEQKEYTEQLKNQLGIVWNRLSDNSKTFLVTACFTYDQLSGNEYRDYSSVCMLITKALEIEVTKYYLEKYVGYLKSNNISPEEWPTSIYKENGKTVTREEFTLGNAVTTTGLKNVKANKGDVSFIISEQDKYDLFCDYYDELIDKSYLGDIDKKVISDCKIIETARINYRNPSAHKQSIGKIVAEGCIEYLLTKRKLYYLLKDMN